MKSNVLLDDKFKLTAINKEGKFFKKGCFFSFWLLILIIKCRESKPRVKSMKSI